jgi:hypothetical protein
MTRSRGVFVRFHEVRLEGLIVALAAFTIPNNKLDINETVTIALVAMCTFSVLDYFAPSMAGAARLVAQVGIGLTSSGLVVRPVDVTHN